MTLHVKLGKSRALRTQRQISFLSNEFFCNTQTVQQKIMQHRAGMPYRQHPLAATPGSASSCVGAQFAERFRLSVNHP
eukprot:6487509-Amphidinium_carterae.4